jgi:peptide chain release factor 1
MQFNEQILSALAKSHSKLKEINEQLETITDDVQKLIKLKKEVKHIEPLALLYVEVKSNIDTVNDCIQIIANEKDQEMISLAKLELENAESKLSQMESRAKILMLPKDENDEKNTIVEMRPAAGGDESSLFVGDLFNCYKVFANEQGWKIEVNEAKLSERGGYDNLIFSVFGDGVFSKLKYESGVHRVQRVPATESKGRVHTSTITVAVLPEVDELQVVIEQKDLRIDVMRASGAGGQSVNKTESAVRVTHLPTNIVVYCQDGKSQNENKAQALKVLRAKLWEKAELERRIEMSNLRKSQIGSGDRSEKIRTYNYPQNRLTDHRIGLTLNKLDQVMQGNISEIINALQAHEQEEQMKNLAL